MVLKEFHIQELAWNKKDTGSIDDVPKNMQTKLNSNLLLVED